MENIVMFKSIKGFCLNCNDLWVYEGQLVNLTTYSGKKHSNAVIEAVIEEQETLVLQCGDEQKYISLHDIDELEIIERRRIK